MSDNPISFSLLLFTIFSYIIVYYIRTFLCAIESKVLFDVVFSEVCIQVKEENMLALVVHLAMFRSHKILVGGYICLHFMNFRCFLSVFTFFFLFA